MSSECESHHTPLFGAVLTPLAVPTVTGQVFECIPTQLAPYGPGYTSGQNQGCAIAGAAPGSTVLDGTTYLDVALRLYRSHLWRNFGIVVSRAL